MADQPQEIFARLLALSAIQEARVKANPVPFLNKVARENHNLRRAMENAIMILSGSDDLDIAQDAIPTLPPSIVETATIRNKKAGETLRRALLEDRDNG